MYYFAFCLALRGLITRKRNCPLLLLVICGVAGLLFSRMFFERAWESVLGGVGVGVFLLICSLVKRESIGFADGVLFCAAGAWLGLWQNLLLLFGATVFCGAAGGILLLSGKCTRKERLAFAPFVLAAYVGMLAIIIS